MNKEPSENRLKFLPEKDLKAMAEAGTEVMECFRVLKKANSNTVAECLKNQGTFYQNDHYPKGDVYDTETFSQYYYHAHREDVDEHGHFHTFLRKKGMPSRTHPVPYDGDAERPEGDDALSHLIAISMDKYGFPKALFTTNRWVTDETFYGAEDVIRMLDHFKMDHSYPNWAVNRWLTAMFILFRPQIEELLIERDETINRWRVENPDVDVYEDRDLEVTSNRPISVEAQMAAIAEALSDSSA